MAKRKERLVIKPKMTVNTIVNREHGEGFKHETHLGTIRDSGEYGLLYHSQNETYDIEELQQIVETMRNMVKIQPEEETK